MSEDDDNMRTLKSFERGGSSASTCRKRPHVSSLNGSSHTAFSKLTNELSAKTEDELNKYFTTIERDKIICQKNIAMVEERIAEATKFKNAIERSLESAQTLQRILKLEHERPNESASLSHVEYEWLKLKYIKTGLAAYNSRIKEKGQKEK